MKYPILLIAVLSYVLWTCAGEVGPAGWPGAEGMRLETIPPRPPGAVTGSEFARRTAGMSSRERQQAALLELRSGNVPEFLRDLTPVLLSCDSSGGDMLRAVIWVAPDYLAIGSNDDFLRIPLGYPSATAIAAAFGCVLPTRKMVNMIYEQSAFHLRPQPMSPGPRMRSSEHYLAHQRKIEKQRAGRPLGELVSGHKKDVVLTKRLQQKPGRVAIFGWHRQDGTPIQPLSTAHGEFYVDYSHGVRLVFQAAWINGERLSILDALQNPDLAPALTYEGAFSRLAQPLRRGR